MLKVSVLGCHSFIGKHLIAFLAQREDVELTAFGRPRGSSPTTGFSAASGKPGTGGGGGKVRFVGGCFEDAAAVREALRGQDIVYHFISQTLPSTTWDSPLIEVEKNLTPSLQLIELAAQAGVKKICFASSGGTVYGLQQDHLTEQSLTEPFSPYGIIKRATESFLQYARARHSLNYDIYRISNVYGEGQNVNKGLGFINTALENVITRRPVVVFGDGGNVRDYIYVKDAVRMLSLSLLKDPADSDIYNVSSNHAVTLNEVLALIREAVGFDFETDYRPSRASDNRKVVLDNSRIMKFFAGMRFTTLSDGIRNTYDYLKKEGKISSQGKSVVEKE